MDTTFVYTKKIVYVTLLCLIATFTHSQNSNCALQLEVDKGRNTRSTSTSGTYYKLHLRNQGNSVDIITLTSRNGTTFCSNSNSLGKIVSNSNLTTNILDTNKVTRNQYTLQPGESITFLMQILVPIGTAINSWCCTEITATSRNCPTVNSSTTVYTMVISDNEN